MEETRALVCEARDLLRQQLNAAAPSTPTSLHGTLSAEAHAALRGTLQQLLPCLCVLCSFERQHAYSSTYELVISAVGQVLGFLTAGDTAASADATPPHEPKTQQRNSEEAEQDEGGAAPQSPRDAPTPANTTATWANTFGCDDAILALRQATTLPQRYPALFTGPRQPWRRLLLYGPPGTGKSRLAAATAAESGAVFLSVSAADLLSKWVGESEKQVRQAFAQAAAATPRCVLFFDEVDALCGARGGHGESELARRLKTEFLLHLQVDVPTVTVLAATNLPWELDAAIVRRFDRFVYVGLPSAAVKRQMLAAELCGVAHAVDDDALDRVVAQTERFSVVDVRLLLAHAVMAPVTEWLLRNDVEKREGRQRAREVGTDGFPSSLTAATVPARCLGPCAGASAPASPQDRRALTSPPRSAVEVLGDGAESDGSVMSESPPDTSATPPARDVCDGPASRVAARHHVPCVEARHFDDALHAITATTTAEELARYTAWRSRAPALR